jgi:hypothetical protein
MVQIQIALRLVGLFAFFTFENTKKILNNFKQKIKIHQRAYTEQFTKTIQIWFSCCWNIKQT